MTTIYLSFNLWLKEVDRLLNEKLCVTTQDIEDRCYRDMYEDGYSPEEVVNEILEESGLL